MLEAILLTFDLLALRSGKLAGAEDLMRLRITRHELAAALRALEIVLERLPLARSAGFDVWRAVADAAFWVRHLFRLRRLPVPLALFLMKSAL